MTEEKQGARQLMAFVVVGGVAALANFGSRFAFGLLVPFGPSVLMAFFVGLTTAFLLNRVFVFSAERGTTWRTEAVRFLVVNLLGLAVTMVVSVGCLWILERTLGRSALVEGGAHFAGLSATTITSYIAHKTWTFAG